MSARRPQREIQEDEKTLAGGDEREFSLGQFLQEFDGMLRERAFLSDKEVISVWENGQSPRFG
jgi:hypothetical protein